MATTPSPPSTDRVTHEKKEKPLSELGALTLPLPIPSDPHYVFPQSTISPSFKALLETKVNHPSLIIPARLTSHFRKSLKSILMSKPKLKDVYPLESDDIIENVDPKTERKIVFTDSIQDIFNHPLVLPLLKKDCCSESYDPSCSNIRKSNHKVILSYNHYTVEQIVSKILPPTLHKEIPSSFEVIGMIAHLNLRPEYLSFKYIIGRIILDKNKSIHVVVNKTGTISNQFRTFPMEIIADERNTNSNMIDKKQASSPSSALEVVVKEDGCKFKLDFEHVYWNSRLQFEHKRLVHLIGNKKNEDQQNSEIIVADACAGIGPFAVPLTTQYNNVKVYANDLNPISYKYLKINVQLNKCNKRNIHTYNMDGREFIRKLDNDGIRYDHVIMNLPAIAPEFLNVFRGWKQREDNNLLCLRPMIHVHCFGSKTGGDEEAINRCSKALGYKLDTIKDEVTVHIVRDVSPKKNMLCVSFRIPNDVKDLELVEEFGDIVSDRCAKYDDNLEEDDRIVNSGEPETKKSRIV